MLSQTVKVPFKAVTRLPLQYDLLALAKHWFVRCRFIWCYIVTDDHGILDCLCSMPVLDLIYLTCLLQNMAKILLEQVVYKEIKISKS